MKFYLVSDTRYQVYVQVLGVNQISGIRYQIACIHNFFFLEIM